MLKAIIAALFVAECAFAPMYLVAIKPGFSTKTLILKMICSLIFTFTGIACAFATGGFDGIYPKFMVIAFACSFLGDVLLHMKENIVRYIIGGCGFLAAHVLFIISFIKTGASLSDNAKIFALRNGIIMAAVLILTGVLYVALKLKAGKLLAPIILYVTVLSFMFSKAVDVSVALWNSGNIPGAVCVTAGAGLFVFSDLMLGMGFFGDKSYKKQVINMAAYYPAQMLLALSIYFI